jgi:heat shock protein HslJ
MKRFMVMMSLLWTVFGLVACGAGGGGAALEDTTWLLQSYGEAGNLQAVLEDTEVTAEFTSKEKTVKGSAGCNSYSGGYELDKNKLTLPGPIISTMMACDEPIMDQETAYLSALQSAESFEIDGEQLRINCGQKVLIFKRR